jgi:hypothetical protein
MAAIIVAFSQASYHAVAIRSGWPFRHPSPKSDRASLCRLGYFDRSQAEGAAGCREPVPAAAVLVLQRRHPQRACAMRTKPETLLRWHRRVGVPIGPGDQIGSTGGLVDGRFPSTSRPSSTEIRIQNRSPRVNAIVERWVKSARTECLDHLFIFSEAGPWRDLSTYVSYFNHWRPQRSIGQRAPRDPEEPQSPSQQKYERSSQTL